MYRKEIMKTFKLSRADAIEIRKLIASDSKESQNYATGTADSRNEAKQAMLTKVYDYKSSTKYQDRQKLRQFNELKFATANRAIVYNNKKHSLASVH